MRYFVYVIAIVTAGLTHAAPPEANPVQTYVTSGEDSPVPVRVQQDPQNPAPLVVTQAEVRFVGQTSTETSGAIGGFRSANALCQQDYGAGARMCTTEEYWRTPTVASHETAWIQPSPVGFVAAETPLQGTQIFMLDFSGGAAILEDGRFLPTCSQWFSDASGNRGMVVNGNDGLNPLEGFAQISPCWYPHRVACCAAVYE